jgi:uncharacterized membrane protein YfhO
MPRIRLPRSKRITALLVILFGIVLYSFFWEPAPNRVTLHITQVEPTTTGRLLQLYYAYGIPGFKDFTERNSVKKFISHQRQDNTISFHLPGFSSLRRIRVDFGNAPGVFQVASIELGYERRATFHSLEKIDGAHLLERFKTTNGITNAIVDDRDLVLGVSENDPYVVLDVSRSDWQNSLTQWHLWYLRLLRAIALGFAVLVVAGGLHVSTLLLKKRMTKSDTGQCALVLLLLTGLYLLNWTPSPNTIRMQVKQSEPLTWGKTLRLYYTYDSIGFRTLQEKNSTTQYIHQSDSYLDVDFSIPGKSGLNIVRFDFGVGEGVLNIGGLYIGYSSWGTFYELAHLPPDALLELLYPNDDVSILLDDSVVLVVEHSGEDPHALLTISEIINTQHFSQEQLVTLKIHRFISTLFLLLAVVMLTRLCRSGWVSVAGSELTPVWNKVSPYLFILGVGVVGFIVYQPYLTLEKLYLFADVANDSVTAFWPLTIHLSEYIRTNGMPLWSFAIGAGQGFYNAFVNPFSFLHAMLPPDWIAYGFGFMQYFKILCAAILFYGWLRLGGVGRYASMVVSVCLCFSAHMIVRGNWVHYATEVVMVAFALYSIELYLIKHRWYLLPFVVVFMVMRGIFHSYIWTIVLLIYCVGRLSYLYQGEVKKQLKSLGKLISFYFLGLLMSSYIIVPGLFSIFNTARMVGTGSNIEPAFTSSLVSLNPPEQWLTSIAGLFSPDLLGRGTIFTGWLNYLDAPHFYIGLIALLLVPQVFCGRSARFRTLIGIVLCLCLMYLFLPWFRYALNAFQGHYYKTSSFWVSLSLAGFAALALDNCIRNRVLNIPLLVITFALCLYFLYAIDHNTFVSSYLDLDKNTNTLAVILFLITSYFISLLFLKLSKLRMLGLLFIPLIFFGEILYIDGNSTKERDNLRADVITTGGFYYDESKDFIKRLQKDDSGFYRIEKSSPTVHFNDALAQGYFGLKSYNSFNSLAYVTALDAFDIDYHHKTQGSSYITGLNNRYILESLLSVKYYLQMLGSETPFSPSYSALAEGEKYLLFANDLFLPLGVFFDKYITENDTLKFPPEMRDLIALKAAIIDKDLRSTFPVQKIDSDMLKNIDHIYSSGYFSSETLQFVRENIGYLKEHAMTLDYFSQNLIIGSIDVNRPGILFLSIPKESGWKFTVNGKETTPLTTHFGFYGLMIESGSHTIEMTYFTPYLQIGFIITLCCIVIFILLLISERISPLFYQSLRPPQLNNEYI